MSDPRDPPRLFAPESGAPDELRRLLEGARTDLLAPDAVERIASASARAVAGADPGAARSAAAGARAMSGSVTRFARIAATVTAVAVGASLWAIEPTRRGSSIENSARRPVPAPAGSSVPALTPEPPSATPTPVASVDDRPSGAISSPPRATATASGVSPTRLPSVPNARPGGVSSDAIEEHRLLRAARAALATNPQQALTLAAEHERRFPNGMLAEEREVIAIEALAREGATEAARDRLEHFQREFPQSVYQPRMDAPRPSSTQD